MEFHPTITVLERGGKGISQMNFEPAVYIGTDSSFRKASHPNWNKDKWPLVWSVIALQGTTCTTWWIDCFFLQLSHAQTSPLLNVPTTISLENLASEKSASTFLVMQGMHADILNTSPGLQHWSFSSPNLEILVANYSRSLQKAYARRLLWEGRVFRLRGCANKNFNNR